MKLHDLKSMSVEELWSVHELIVSVLASKISAKKHGLSRDCASLAKVQLTALKK